MTRPVINGESEARADLANALAERGQDPSRPAWLRREHQLPFQGLSDDEFEVLCYLLLLREFPEERITYYGKTGDAGRDIMRVTADGTVELIQCKRYSSSVGLPAVRTELAKVCANVFSGKIPQRPDRIVFYAVPDLAPLAVDLLQVQPRWQEGCGEALEVHLKKPPSPDLLEFASGWWPNPRHEDQHKLTQRVLAFPELLGEFFEMRAVVTGSLEEIKPDLASVKQTVESVDARLRDLYSAVQSPTGTGQARDNAPTSSLSTTPAGQSLQLKVLMARMSVLEEQERRHLDEKGKQLWESIQSAMRELNLAQAVAAGKGLATWMEDEGRRASAVVRGRAAVLLADLAVIESSRRHGAECVDTAEARRWYHRALAEFGTGVSEEDATRIVGLDAKLLYIEGSEAEAARALEGATEPSSFNLRLSIWLERGELEPAVQALDGHALHERWCDRAVLINLLSGNIAQAMEAIAWARKQTDPAILARCLLAFAQATIRRLVANRPVRDLILPALGDEARAALEEARSMILPLLTYVESASRPRSGVEEEALVLGMAIAKLLGDAKSCERYALLLGAQNPVPIEFARAALRGDTDTPAELPARLRRDYPELLEAHCLAALLEADRLDQRHEAFTAVIALQPLARSLRQREELCSTVAEIAAPAGEAMAARAEDLAEQLLGAAHPFTQFAKAIKLLQTGNVAEAEPLIQSRQASDDPLWLQISASLKLLQKNESGALDDLTRASRLLPREEILDRTAWIAGKLGNDEAAEPVLQSLVAVSPRRRDAWTRLAVVRVRLGKHAQAAECFRRLGEMDPSEVSYGANEGKALSLAGRKEEGLRVLNAVCARHPHALEALGSRAILLEAMDRPDQAFGSLEPVREHFWSDAHFLLLYLSLAYKARREQEAHLAFQRLLELKSQGQQIPLRGFTIEEVEAIFRQRRQQHEQQNRTLLAGRVPWLLVGRGAGRPPYADWAWRTREVIVPDDPQSRAECAVYATNGWSVCQSDAGERILEVVAGCLPASTAVVADLSALLTLHRLQLLDRAATYFGKIVIPAGYAHLSIEDQADLQSHQPSVFDALRAIRDAVDVGRILRAPPDDGRSAMPSLLDEDADGDQRCYRLVDLVAWLRRAGRINADQMMAFSALSHQCPSEGMPPVEQAASGGFVTTVFTLRRVCTAGLLAEILRATRLYLTEAEIAAVRWDLRADSEREEVAGWHRDLWDAILGDPRFERVEPRHVPMNPGKCSVENEHSEPDILLSAALLAHERGLPLLADDRFYQAIFLHDQPVNSHAAFGTDCLLGALSDAGHISEEELANHYLQLLRWRYRFLVPPVQVLICLAARHLSYLPGEPLREVSRYVHDCMRDPGLLAGFEPTTPPVSVAWKSQQHWVQHVARFLVGVWHDDRFDDASATTLTAWALAELLPSPPHSLARIGAIVATFSTATHVMGTAFSDVWQYRNRHRSNLAIRSIADALDLSHEEYLDMVAHFLEVDFAQGTGGHAEEDVRRAQQLLAYTAVRHISRFNSRSFFALQRIGLVQAQETTLAPDQLAAIEDGRHSSRAEAPPGPLVFLHNHEQPNGGVALSVPELVLDPSRRVREVALHFFLAAPKGPGTWLSPRSRAAFGEYASALRSDVESEWLPAGCRLYELLEEDFLLNLAGLRQARLARLRDEQNAYWRRVIRPGLSLSASIPVEWYGVPDGDASASFISRAIQDSSSLSDAFRRYLQRFGHLPLASPHSAAALLRRWAESRGQRDTAWHELWSSARAANSPLAIFHACSASLECPDLVPIQSTDGVWTECATILRFGWNDPAAQNAGSVPWRLRSDLARHYLGQLKLHTADQEPNRLASLAWWTAEQVGATITELTVEETGATGPGEITAQLQSMLDRSLSSEAELTDSMCDLLGPGTAASPFSFGTMDVRSLWGIALLSSARVGFSTTPIPEMLHSDLNRTVVGACLLGFPPATCSAATPLALQTPIVDTATWWVEQSTEHDDRSFLQAVLGIRHSVGEPKALAESLRRLAVADEAEKVVICHTVRIAGILGGIDEESVWQVLSDADWTRACFTTLDSSLLHIICLGLLELQRREGGRWNWALPHYFAGLCDEADIDDRRREILCAAAIRSCVIGGTVRAIRQLQVTARSQTVMNALARWKDQLGVIRRLAPPIVGAYLRDTLSSLPHGINPSNVQASEGTFFGP